MQDIINMQILWWNCVHTFPALCCNRNMDANNVTMRESRNFYKGGGGGPGPTARKQLW